MSKWLGVLLILWVVGFPGAAQEDPAPLLPTLSRQDRGGDVLLYLDNPAGYEVTLTLEAELNNMSCEPSIPFTAVFPGQERSLVAHFRPDGGDGRLQYRWYWQPGSDDAEHDDSTVYQLPFPSGMTCHVEQGYYGTFSHQGQAAVDFRMPEGTPVRAAREGSVIATEDRFPRGGTRRPRYYTPRANYIMVRHPDGTYGEYYHLQQGGVLVRRGQRVETGQVIGYSGMSGYASGPHLHFVVFMAADGHHRRSFEVHFRARESQEPVIPLEDHSYTAL